jgi:hypothetical protein
LAFDEDFLIEAPEVPDAVSNRAQPFVEKVEVSRRAMLTKEDI